MHKCYLFISVDEDDVFQCGKCKKQYCSLSAFLSHKQSRCNGQRNVLPQAMSRTNQNVQDIILTTHSRGPVSTTETASVSRAAQVIQVLPNTLITCLFIKQELLLFNQAGILITLIKLYLGDRSQGLFSCPIVISHLFFTPSIAYFASMFKDIHL